MPTFVGSDVLQIASGLALGLAVVFLPGYGLGWALNLLDFRERSGVAKLCLSAPLGISLLPILIYLPYRFISVRVAIAFIVVLACFGAYALLFRGRNSVMPPAWIIVAIGIWVVIAAFILMDVQMGDCAYNSTLSWDHGVRVQMVAALSHTDRLPLTNYIFHPGHSVVIRYHYFSYFFPSFFQRFSFGAITARNALIAYIIWVGIALLGTIAAYLSLFLAFKSRKVLLTAWCLLLVGGLQVLPFLTVALGRAIRGHTDAITLPSLVLWNTEAQVNSWLDSLLWVPNHVSALIGLLMGCLLLWHARGKEGTARWLLTFASGIAFASGVGLSVYVCLMFAVFLGTLALFLLRSYRRESVIILAAGAVSFVFALPFLVELIAHGNAPSAFSFWVRGFDLVNFITHKFDIESQTAKNLMLLVALPLNYFSELGLFFATADWWLQDHRTRRPFTPQQKLMLYMLCLSVLICSFVRSFPWNDFGWRGLLPAQFVLLLMAAEIFSGSLKQPATANSLRQRMAILLVVVGLASTFTEIVILRSYPLLADRGWAVKSVTLNQTPDTGHHTEQLRSAYEWVRSHTPTDSVVQQNPNITQEIALGLYSERRTSVFGKSYIPLATTREHSEFMAAYATISQLYQPGVSAERELQLCNQADLDYIVVQDVDPVWQDKSSFVWSQPPVFAAPLVRVFHCRPDQAR